MRNKIIKSVYIGLLVLVIFGQFLPNIAVGVTSVTPPAAPETGFERICSRSIGVAGCIQKLYLFSLGLGAIIALLMIVLAGYRYMTASGNAEAVSAAKESIEVAFKGVIIIFVGFILLYLINPDLVQFKNTSGFFPAIEFDSTGKRIP